MNLTRFVGLMRPIPVARTALLSLVTLGIYGAVWAHRNGEDLHQDHHGFRHWRLLFWLGFVTLTVTWTVLAVMNFVHLNRLRAAAGIPPHAAGIWAMVLWFWLWPVAAYLWARYWNHSIGLLGALAAPGAQPKGPLPAPLARRA